MRTRCPSCGGVVESPEAMLERCPACGQLIDGALDDPEVTIPPAGALPDATIQQGRPGGLVPPRLSVSLAIVGGERSGEVVRLEQARFVIGRPGGGADLEIDDPALSRRHAALEVMGHVVVLRDLASRNGTFVGGQRIDTATLEDRAEFRLGGTSFMLVLTPRGPEG
jgi:pSer/pThr/pTyr-binding forkhead associated (FHA) protein